MKSLVETKDLPTAHRWESLRSAYYRHHGMNQEADRLQALADFYFQKICTPEPEEVTDEA